MIGRRGFLLLMAGVAVSARAREAEASQLSRAQKQLMLVTEMTTRDDAGKITAVTRYKEPILCNDIVDEADRHGNAPIGLSETGISDGIKTFEKETDDSIPVSAKIVITVGYSNNGKEIAIKSGKYSIVQTDPFVAYTNSWYALMQKENYVMNYFTSDEADYKTGWEPTAYDPEQDKWTCGSGMGATITDFLNDSTYSFALDCYIE